MSKYTFMVPVGFPKLLELSNFLCHFWSTYNYRNWDSEYSVTVWKEPGEC